MQQLNQIVYTREPNLADTRSDWKSKGRIVHNLL